MSKNKLEKSLPALINVCVFGMDERLLQRLKTMFTIIFKGQFTVTECKSALLAIIDLDGEHTNDEIENFKQLNSTMPLIYLCEKNPSLTDTENRITLQKPLKKEQFMSAVTMLLYTSKKNSEEQSIKKVQVKTSESAQALNGCFKEKHTVKKVVRSYHSTEEIYYNPNEYLQGYIQNLMNQKHPEDHTLILEFPSKHFINLYPDSRMALTNLSDIQLKGYGLRTLENEKKVTLSIKKGADIDKDLSYNIQDSTKTPIDTLLWSLALNTSRGRLAKGLSLNKLLSLNSWPNLTRLAPTPNAMRINAFWVGQPRSLADIVHSLGISSQEMYSYCSAAYAIGLINTAKRKEDTFFEPQKINKENKRRGLFGAILRCLK